MTIRPLVALVAAVALAATACSSEDDSSDAGDSGDTTTTADAPAPSGPERPIVFNGQGNHLDAYDSEPTAAGEFPTQRVITSAEEQPDGGLDINAQICFLPPTEDGEQWFIAGEDTGQPDRPAGWGIFRLTGTAIGDLRATQIAKLTPTYNEGSDGPENYGCGVLSDGRIVTTDIGDQAAGDGNGQLIVWFPPFTGGSAPDFTDVAYCKLDVGLATAQLILVRDDTIYVAAARGGVYRYDGPFPTSADPDGGCETTDATGAPMTETVQPSVFIESGEHGLGTPSGLADAPDGGFYVSSVFTGVINEYGSDGSFRRTILQPPSGESIGESPFSTGTPLGIGVGPDGTLYYADIGIVMSDGGIGPGDDTGTVRRIVFVDGEPQPPEVMAESLAYPDGIGVWSTVPPTLPR